MSIVLQGSTSGSITLQEPAVAGSTVLDLPAVSGTILTTGSSGQSIPKAALPTGSVLQVVQGTYNTSVSTNSTSYVTTNLTASITPTSSSSKILVLANGQLYSSAAYVSTTLAIYRASTKVYENSGGYNTAGGNSGFVCLSYLDSPATTSSTAYTIYFRTENTSVTCYFNSAGLNSSIVLLEIAA